MVLSQLTFSLLRGQIVAYHELEVIQHGKYIKTEVELKINSHKPREQICFLFQEPCVAGGVDSESEGCSIESESLPPQELYSPWDSPGQNMGLGSLSLLQGIFPTQGSNPGLPHYRWILYQLSHEGSPRILEWVAYRFFRRFSPSRNRTRVSCIAGGFLSN